MLINIIKKQNHLLISLSFLKVPSSLFPGIGLGEGLLPEGIVLTGRGLIGIEGNGREGGNPEFAGGPDLGGDFFTLFL